MNARRRRTEEELNEEETVVRRKEVDLEAKIQINNAERKEVSQNKHELTMTTNTFDNLRFKVALNKYF